MSAVAKGLGYFGHMAWAAPISAPMVLKTMVLEDVWALLQRELFWFPSTPTLCNQYNSNDARFDLPQGEMIRRQNLRNYLSSFPRRPAIMVIGEAPGWRGCRFSGVPFTSEAQLARHALPFPGLPSSRRGSPYKESTATTFWQQLSAVALAVASTADLPRFFAWNCVPFHLHRPGDPLSNRPPTRRELVSHATLLAEIIALLQPDALVAVGRSAEKALASIGRVAYYVRHPAHGGSGEFREGIERIFRHRILRSA